MEAILEHKFAPGVSGFALFRLMPEFKRNIRRGFHLRKIDVFDRQSPDGVIQALEFRRK